MEFKLLEEKDLKNMKQILENDNTEYNIDYLKEFITKENNYGFIAIKDNNVVAFLYGYKMLRPDGRKMFYIHSVDVLPEYQNQGIGSKLMEYTLSYIKQENDCYKFFVLTEKDNIKACKLYTKYATRNEQVLFSNKI